MESNKDTITVTIGVFSGHPNPKLSLDAEAVEKLAELVRTARGKEPGPPPPPPRLGYYYGFFVEAPRELAKRLELPLEFSLYEGVITEGKGRDQKHWRDVAHIEQFLFEQAWKHGYGELLEKVGGEKPK